MTWRTSRAETGELPNSFWRSSGLSMTSPCEGAVASRMTCLGNISLLKSSTSSSLVPAVRAEMPEPSSRCASIDLNLVQALDCPMGMTAIVSVFSSGCCHFQSLTAMLPVKWDGSFPVMSPKRLNQSYMSSYLFVMTFRDDSSHVAVMEMPIRCWVRTMSSAGQLARVGTCLQSPMSLGSSAHLVPSIL